MMMIDDVGKETGTRWSLIERMWKKNRETDKGKT